MAMSIDDNYYMRDGKILKAKMERVYYLLIKEQIASRKERTFAIRSQHGDQTHVLEGSLWYECPSTSEIDDYRTIDRSLLLQSVEFDDVVMKCKAQDVHRLNREQFEVLLALNTCSDRYKVFQDTIWMKEALEMDPGTIVEVLKMPGLPEKVPAKIKYKGYLSNKEGLWYGVELSAEYHGKGTTNGTYLGEPLFSSPIDSGFFLAINKLRKSHQPGSYREAETDGIEKAESVDALDYYNEPIKPEQLPPNLEVGERVVWISDHGDEHGVVKWIGILPGSIEKEWTVGVEFDNPIGTGTGKYNNRQLFRAKQYHASLIPLLGLMKEDEFYSSIPPPPPLEQHLFEPVNISDLDGVCGDVVPVDPPPPTPPASENNDQFLLSPEPNNYSFKPRKTNIKSSEHSQSGDFDTVDSRNDIRNEVDFCTPSDLSHIPRSTDTSSSGTARTKEDIAETLKYGGSVGRFSSSNTSKSSRTTTPDSANRSSQNTLIRVNKSPAGPKPPDKQQKVIEEKSIYDRDPDHPYENVEKPPGEDDYDDADFPLGGDRIDLQLAGKAFAAQEDLYEPLEVRNRRDQALLANRVKELDYAPLDKYRAQRQEVTNHYPTINPRSDHHHNNSPKNSPTHSVRTGYSTTSTTTLSPTGISDIQGPPYYENAQTVLGNTTRSPSQNTFSSGTIVGGSQSVWGDSNFGGGSTVKALGSSALSDSSSRLSEADRFSIRSGISSTATEHSYLTSRTHLTASTISPADQQQIYANVQSPPPPPARPVNGHHHTQPITPHDDIESVESFNSSTRTSYASLPPMPSSGNGRQKSSSLDNIIDANASKKPQEHSQPSSTSTTTREITGSLWRPEPLDPSELDGDLEIGSMVEVEGNPPECRFGVIRWIGYLRDKHKPIAGLEMELESNSCTGGSFANTHLFDCPPKKGFFIYMHKLKKDSRFEEATKFAQRSDSLTFGSLECPDIEELCDIPDNVVDVSKLVGKQRGIQGHHNSCYLDATLFSMFSFSLAFDSILFRPKEKDDIKAYTEVQKVLREGIVNPLRKNFFVRADKVLKLRKLLDSLSDIKGLVTEEKDPEEFLNCLLEQIMRVEPLIRLSSGQNAYLYQLFIEQDERIKAHPTTQQLLGLSFLQSNLKLREVPSCLILQMPRFGKDYKMYRRIIPSLTIDITGILENAPRECTICGKLAAFECKDCLWQFGDGSDLEQCSFCELCNANSHRHPKRARHVPTRLELSDEYRRFLEESKTSEPPVHKQLMELFAVVCIETSHYVAFVKCGTGPTAPWIFFDSMADRMGAENGYNVPAVSSAAPCVPDWLRPENHHRIEEITDDRNLPEMLKRVLCDGYICMYQSTSMTMYK